MSFLRRYLPLCTFFLAIGAFYFYKLDGVGVLDPDEPRYSAIGRNMANTGDFVTPVLWGSPWFEKPPLLYWMTAAGTACGLTPDLSGRLPVALLSLSFLVVAAWLIGREFGFDAALWTVVFLATSAGWIAYSNLALTDLPLSAFFTLAVLLALPLLSTTSDGIHLAWRFAAIGACLGLAALAKGLVPVALAVPFAWFLRRYWRYGFVALAAFAVVAAPWYIAVYLKNGHAFVYEFFYKHHFERLYSASLQHVQPWYYYFPVLLAALFPWTPLLGLLATKSKPWDVRHQFLASVTGFGFVFFSVSLNKLPGYLLPLIPSVFILIGSQIAGRKISRLWFVPCALLIALIPMLAHLLPTILSTGRMVWRTTTFTRIEAFFVILPVAVVFLTRRSWMTTCLALCVAAGGFYLKDIAYPVMETTASPRGLWRSTQEMQAGLCDAGTNRSWVYGLEFYRASIIPECGKGKFAFFLHSQGHNRPTIEPFKKPDSQ